MGGTLAVTGNTTVGGTLGVTGTATLSGNATIGANDGDTRFHLNSANQYTMKFSNAGNVSGHIGGGGADVLRFSNVAGATIMEMNAGQITKPLQPVFLVQPASTQSNVAEGADVVVIFGTERFDVGSNFASNAFTAPVTGKYFLSYSLFVTQVDKNPNYFETYLVTSNRTYTHTIDPRGFDVDPAYWTFNQATVVDMDAGDTAQIKLNIHNGGAVQSDIATYSYFSGYLVS
jgi:hypothetical protein